MCASMLTQPEAANRKINGPKSAFQESSGHFLGSPSLCAQPQHRTDSCPKFHSDLITVSLKSAPLKIGGPKIFAVQQLHSLRIKRLPLSAVLILPRVYWESFSRSPTPSSLAQTVCPNYFSVQKFPINFSVSIRSISMILEIRGTKSELRNLEQIFEPNSCLPAGWSKGY